MRCGSKELSRPPHVRRPRNRIVVRGAFAPQNLKEKGCLDGGSIPPTSTKWRGIAARRNAHGARAAVAICRG